MRLSIEQIEENLVSIQEKLAKAEHVNCYKSAKIYRRQIRDLKKTMKKLRKDL